MDKEKFDNHSDIDFLDVDEMLLSYKKYLKEHRKEIEPEEYDKLRSLHTEDESDYILGKSKK